VPERKATCLDCWASSTFPDGDWQKGQRPAIEAWARAHELAAHPGKQSRAGTLTRTRPTITNERAPRQVQPGKIKYLMAAWA